MCENSKLTMHIAHNFHMQYNSIHYVLRSLCENSKLTMHIAHNFHM